MAVDKDYECLLGLARSKLQRANCRRKITPRRSQSIGLGAGSQRTGVVGRVIDRHCRSANTRAIDRDSYKAGGLTGVVGSLTEANDRRIIYKLTARERADAGCVECVATINGSNAMCTGRQAGSGNRCLSTCVECLRRTEVSGAILKLHRAG